MKQVVGTGGLLVQRWPGTEVQGTQHLNKWKLKAVVNEDEMRLFRGAGGKDSR